MGPVMCGEGLVTGGVRVERCALGCQRTLEETLVLPRFVFACLVFVVDSVPHT